MTLGASRAPVSPTSRPTRIGRGPPPKGKPHSIAPLRCSEPKWRYVWFQMMKRRGTVIVRVASEMNADVLVVGSSSKGWLSRLFGGSVSDYVAHHAPCPVMLIRHDH